MLLGSPLFKKRKKLSISYSEFLVECEQLTHKSVVDEKSASQGFYLPHHAVVKEDSPTTEVRVAFDGSRRSSSGISLDDTLMIGPTLQEDFFSLLLRFRS